MTSVNLRTLSSGQFADMINYDPERALNVYREIESHCDAIGIHFIDLNELVKYLNQRDPEFRELVDSILLEIANKF